MVSSFSSPRAYLSYGRYSFDVVVLPGTRYWAVLSLTNPLSGRHNYLPGERDGGPERLRDLPGDTQLTGVQGATLLKTDRFSCLAHLGGTVELGP